MGKRTRRRGDTETRGKKRTRRIGDKGTETRGHGDAEKEEDKENWGQGKRHVASSPSSPSSPRPRVPASPRLSNPYCPSSLIFLVTCWYKSLLP
ncbi:MAG: hypothetical protein RMY29_023940 [Nostoc sp. CreGUA01]|nr:hypothetical protein [Nostoc sp. CreGUA01]